MAEFKFVLKSFLITCVIVFCLQIKVGEQTLDHKLNHFLQNGQLTNLLKDAGEGATRITASAYNSAKEGDLSLPFKAMKHTETAKEDFQKYQNAVQEEIKEITEE